MNETATPPPAPASVADLAERTAHQAETMDQELAEIDLLVQQARTEASRHEAKRAQVADRLATAHAAGAGDPVEQLDLSGQLVTLTKRAVLMEAQVEVLEGKAKVIRRYRDIIAELASSLAAAVPGSAVRPGGSGGHGDGPPTVSRIVLSAQEDLRREIARAMHDGPAQSLTNIVLQAQIVERLVASDPELARGEIQQLVSMVQSTLDATKTFIFDVRPMVLDDLGLVPTLRRAVRERGRRSERPVEFESLGPDRRLPMEIESGLFRILDEALVGFVSVGPDRVGITLDWGDQLEAIVAAERAPAVVPALDDEPASAQPAKGKGKSKDEELPPALRAMIEERRSAHAAAVEAAHQAAIVALPSTAWREIQDRATTLGIATDLRTGESTGPNPGDPVRTELRLTTEIADLPETG
jgi:two-component system sensor histidine kinase DegS